MISNTAILTVERRSRLAMDRGFRGFRGSLESRRRKSRRRKRFSSSQIFFIFIFRDVKRNYCFSLHVGWIGCRMDSLPALVVWMAVLPDASPANCDRPVSPRGPCLYNKLGGRRHPRSTSWPSGNWILVCSPLGLAAYWIQAERVPTARGVGARGAPPKSQRE